MDPITDPVDITGGVPQQAFGFITGADTRRAVEANLEMRRAGGDVDAANEEIVEARKVFQKRWDDGRPGTFRPNAKRNFQKDG